MRRVTFFLLMLAACSGASADGVPGSGGAGPSGADGAGGSDPSGSGGGGGGGATANAAPPRKVCTGFASTASKWAVPDDAFDRVNALYGQWLTLDLDGDGKVDLVRANDPANDGHAFGAAGGKPYWEMYRGNGSGFDKTPTPWSVPDASYDRVNALYGQWLTMDIDGDRKLDLVIANDAANDGHAFGATGGKPYWQVFKGGASGFASTPMQWSVPDATFDRVNAIYGQWVTFDLDGDGKVDVVRANDPANDGHAFGAAGGKSYWQMFRGNGSGFDATPTSWSVPDDTYDRVNAIYGQWLTLDLDGDGKRDLVRANDPKNDGHAFGASGGSYWEFHKGTASGFAPTPSQWSVPDDTYDRVNAIYGQWLTLDLDDDGKLDLVRANDPANDGHAFGAGGKSYWQFHKGTANGFAKTPSQWSVPDDTYDRVNALYGQWLTMDLDGDGCLDLVRADDPANDGHAFAGPSWQRFAAQ